MMLVWMVDNSEDAQHPQHLLPHREVWTDEQGSLRQPDHLLPYRRAARDDQGKSLAGWNAVLLQWKLNGR